MKCPNCLHIFYTEAEMKAAREASMPSEAAIARLRKLLKKAIRKGKKEPAR